MSFLKNNRIVSSFLLTSMLLAHAELRRACPRRAWAVKSGKGHSLTDTSPGVSFGGTFRAIGSCQPPFKEIKQKGHG